MIKKILILVVLLVSGFLAYVAMQPSEMTIAREMLINATPEQIFPYINSSRKANEWMPWQESDPGAVMTYSGPEEGVGSTSSWDSSGQMGVGKAVVSESVPNQRVITQLTYTKPMQMSQVAEISLTPGNQGTLVRWSVTGESPFIGRVICTLLSMSKIVGDQFEQGLGKLKGMVEKTAS